MKASRLVMIFGGILCCSLASAAQQIPADCRELDQVFYADAAEQDRTLGRGNGLEIESVRIRAIGESPDEVELQARERHRSPEGTAFFVQVDPDTSQSGPWDTTVFVHGNEARPLGVRVDLLNHASYGADLQWINEKLLYIQVWSTRITTVDLILNVEDRNLLYAEGANYRSLIAPCEEKLGVR